MGSFLRGRFRFRALRLRVLGLPALCVLCLPALCVCGLCGLCVCGLCWCAVRGPAGAWEPGG
ncbi:hypothetical protein B7C62_11575 [Kitasatospora albolonga]|uniref:Uncharacterized protein n=1 Tax=Kitasatospora albolonga TaxID=68173 RepID=A0ABC8BR07_9ACTN|nr:hypothetical protein B7C62_11575 [Kitasatospora albolonga]